ncbi:MAG: transposase [Leptolyngbya sp. Prado105]|nr:transposase [Leptolyngbya sp. Prado105]
MGATAEWQTRAASGGVVSELGGLANSLELSGLARQGISESCPTCLQRGQQLYVEGIAFPLTVSWFWLKQANGKRELRFVVSTYPYSGVYLVRLGRKRWAIESFFKTIKHRFGLHCFGQSTKRGVYRWLVLSLIAYLLAYWVVQAACLPQLDWKVACDLALSVLFASVLWFRLLRQLQNSANLAAQYGFEIILKALPSTAYREWCKI